MARSIFIVVLVLGLAVARTQGRTYATGDLRIPCQGSCPAAAINPNSTAAMPAGCDASASADLPTRWGLPEYSSTWKATSTSGLRWGPDLYTYANVTASQVPTSCNPTAWAWSRMKRAITDTIALGLNYCHHHAPAYVTPASVQVWCNPIEDGVDNSSCVCNAAGANRTMPWQGVDCSNFVAWILNFAFGFYPTSSIGEQACHPTYAPGRLLNNITTSKLEQLLPGDLLYITLSSVNRTAPVRVSHAIMWTGWVADMNASATGPLSASALLANVPSNQLSSMQSCMNARAHAKPALPVYVIADSRHNGPALRPFCGWYNSSFSHARRVIDPSPSLPTNVNTTAYWDDAAGSCMSMWALRG